MCDEVDVLQAVIRANHLEMNVRCISPIQNGRHPLCDVFNPKGTVPTLQSLCTHQLCIQKNPLVGEGPARVECNSVPGIFHQVQVPDCTTAKMEALSFSSIDESVDWVITMPLDWQAYSMPQRSGLINTYNNNLELIKLGLLTEAEVDLTYLDPQDTRATKKKRKLGDIYPPYTEEDLGQFVDMLLENDDGEPDHNTLCELASLCM